MNEISITYSSEELLKMIEEIRAMGLFALIIATCAVIGLGFVIVKHISERD